MINKHYNIKNYFYLRQQKCGISMGASFRALISVAKCGLPMGSWRVRWTWTSERRHILHWSLPRWAAPQKKLMLVLPFQQPHSDAGGKRSGHFQGMHGRSEITFPVFDESHWWSLCWIHLQTNAIEDLVKKGMKLVMLVLNSESQLHFFYLPKCDTAPLSIKTAYLCRVHSDQDIPVFFNLFWTMAHLENSQVTPSTENIIKWQFLAK